MFKLALLALCALPAVLACQSATSLIEAAEGFRSCEYVDTTGHPTVCYGFNLDRSDAPRRIASVGGNYNAVRNGGCLSTTQCQDLLGPDVASAASSAMSIFGNQCSCINAVVTDMTYNLGAAGMREFGTFISLIKSHQWSRAASDIKTTLWCRQVGTRCTRDAGIIANGCPGEAWFDMSVTSGEQATTNLRASIGTQ